MPPRRGPARSRRREVPVDVPDIESVRRDQPEERSPPRARQRIQEADEHVPPPPLENDFGVLRQGLLDLLTQNQIIREEMAEIRAENRALREEMTRGRPLVVPEPVQVPEPTPAVLAEPNPPAFRPRRVARRRLVDKGVLIHDF